jgi:hypothetical protein
MGLALPVAVNKPIVNKNAIFPCVSIMMPSEAGSDLLTGMVSVRCLLGHFQDKNKVIG